MSVDELEGFILSNNKRRDVVSVLEKEGLASFSVISKKKRIPERILESILEELIEKDIVEQEEGDFCLTDLGEKIVANSHEFDSG
ncbi:MAG: Transcriptional regulator containing HTH domain ArsR family [Candidatus Methanohalarchaeum thermophilum]|uniref:Transcriptional regulator containing HTH domain ArsR family n=1 Tax=Methanohalarchaeum thermophilum TaxID=1903181 RepID=A0A1Q6DTV4_METT1|nr:MAG: Transcriptional regulator containing HTH domain ArsR family [Candidatus Methanohalarchaeum thermophilum]